MKIVKIFKKQGIVWVYLIMTFLTGVVFIISSRDNVPLGIFVISIGLLFSYKYIYEIVNPKTKTVEAKFKKVKNIPTTSQHIGYRFYFEVNGKTKKFYIYRNYDSFDRLVKAYIDVILKEDVIIKITYLTKSRVLLKFEGTPNEELNKILNEIFSYYWDKRLSWNREKKYWNIYYKYVKK